MMDLEKKQKTKSAPKQNIRFIATGQAGGLFLTMWWKKEHLNIRTTRLLNRFDWQIFTRC